MLHDMQITAIGGVLVACGLRGLGVLLFKSSWLDSYGRRPPAYRDKLRNYMTSVGAKALQEFFDRALVFPRDIINTNKTLQTAKFVGENIHGI